ncbi:MAG: hypothetical protein M1829_006415 [Trizodia sp. TS-e1964]|nr:MAG: hypothetical protein M1829_006415 [Trizodia sp. TS-e1964]
MKVPTLTGLILAASLLVRCSHAVPSSREVVSQAQSLEAYHIVRRNEISYTLEQFTQDILEASTAMPKLSPHFELKPRLPCILYAIDRAEFLVVPIPDRPTVETIASLEVLKVSPVKNDPKISQATFRNEYNTLSLTEYASTLPLNIMRLRIISQTEIFKVAANNALSSTALIYRESAAPDEHIWLYLIKSKVDNSGSAYNYGTPFENL